MPAVVLTGNVCAPVYRFPSFSLCSWWLLCPTTSGMRTTHRPSVIAPWGTWGTPTTPGSRPRWGWCGQAFCPLCFSLPLSELRQMWTAKAVECSLWRSTLFSILRVVTLQVLVVLLPESQGGRSQAWDSKLRASSLPTVTQPLLQPGPVSRSLFHHAACLCNRGVQGC